ncbi:hypothetical protein ACFFJ4_10990 [Xanthomonas dyei]|uniref:Endonuclease/exonuclease/phosphatase domain-containing protein n=1 Tax=Xanthomonas dyei TaxID=743699 RepID=A0A2S7C5R9_9XANT|nr:hypothetical protein [Xanthomonas dyei]PPU56929.1 hypothetical protein XdyCFBP7245_07655 [Xanthomonas dyei]
MKILFWNTLRLGSGTTGEKAVLAEGVIAEAFNEGAEFAVLCEVTSDTTLGDASIDKALVMARRGKKKQSSQLGYAALDNEFTAAACVAYQPPPFADVFGFSAYRKGGNAFANHSKRYVARLEGGGDVDCYVYHANASTKAAYLVAWIVEALRQTKRRFILFGDLNCEPAVLIDYIRYNHQHGNDVGAPEDFIVAFSGPTHNARNGATKVYDYAIAANKTAVTVDSMNIAGVMSRAAMSDHLPIYITFS